MTSHRSHSKSILTKTIHVGASTLISRIFGLAREILLLRFLGMGFIADAFDTAFMLPNSLRKIFAEGALTSAFVPSFIQSFKTEGKSSANALTTLSFIVFESLLLVICAIVMYFPYTTIHMIAPGYSPAKIEATIPLLQILMPFIFFISSSALLSGALNAIHHFFIPAFAPVILNCAFLVGILGCLYYDHPITFLCWAIMAGGFLQCVMHFIAYFYYGFSFRKYDSHTISTFKSMLTKFLFCFLSSSVMEIGLFVDQGFASYLPDGTVNLIKKSHRLMGIPLGIFAVAFSTILLPYFTKTKIDNPEKIEFYLNESLKLVLWVTLPATIIMIFFSEEIFLTLFAYFSSKFSIARLPEAGMILSAFLSGLLFFSLNKILTTLFFALHNTKVPTIVTSLGTVVNICANYLLVHTWGATGLAAATSIGGMFQTILFIYFLHAQYAYRINYKVLLSLSIRYCIIMSGTLTALYYLYKKCFVTIQALHIPFFIIGPGFWLWVGPLILVAYGVFYMTRKWIGSEIYFLE